MECDMNSKGGDFQASKPKQCWRTGEDVGSSFSFPLERSTWTLYPHKCTQTLS